MKAIVTLESLKEAIACYFNEPEDTQRLQALLPPEGLPVTAASVELARAAGVPDQDIFWALNYACPQVTNTHRRLVACACARRALEAERVAGREPDPRSRIAVEASERFARVEATDHELEEAWAAAAAAAAASAASCANAAAAWRFAVDTFVKIINQEGTN